MARDQWLLCDADDTLWENNIFFEEAIRDFVAYVDHPVLGAAQVRERLDQVESRNIRLRGYGTANFGLSLLECLEELRGRSASAGERRHLQALTDTVFNAPMRLLPGVPETLAELRSRYRLGLVTKGNEEEQRSKLDQSGLASAFEHMVTVPEKDTACYRAVIKDVGADADSTWMIGNSPKSDINPALRAGLGAVLVPNDHTWRLEMQALPVGHERFCLVKQFSELTSLF